MDSIIIGFSTSKYKWNPIAAAIRLAEGAPFSHTYVKFWSPSIQRWLIYHASRTRLNFMNLEFFQKESKIVEEHEIPVTPEQKVKVIQYCVDTVWKSYGTRQLLGMAWVRLWRRLGVAAKNPFRDNQRTQVCSELVGHVLRIIGEDIDPRVLEVEGPRWIHGKVLERLQRTQK
jgi:hypothetical protein